MEEFGFRINNVQQIKNINNLQDVIASVSWMYYLKLDTEDRKAMRSISGVLILDVPDTNEGFIPVENINANTIISWVENALDIPAMQERLRLFMDHEMVPPHQSIIESLNEFNNPQ